MSGGYFNYRQYACDDIASEIDEIIASNDSTEQDEWGYDIGRHYPPDIIAKFKETSATLRKAGKMAHRVDWLVSNDDGEDNFRKRWAEEIGG